jgi:hypothetical protein
MNNKRKRKKSTGENSECLASRYRKLMDLSCKHVWGSLNEPYWYQRNLLLKVRSMDQQLQQDMGA